MPLPPLYAEAGVASNVKNVKIVGNVTNYTYYSGAEAKAYGFIGCYVVPYEGLLRYCAYGNRAGGLYVNPSAR